MAKSLVYSNIFFYRWIMQFLYSGGYKKRYQPVITSMPKSANSVIELCFGDILLAEHCKKNKITWTGYDLNESFVSYAQKKGYNAKQADILALDNFPQADVYVMAGSLYHFHNNLENLFDKIFKSSGTMILSEPVKNISAGNNFLGKLAKKWANAGKGEESFRFNEQSLTETLHSLTVLKDKQIEVVDSNRDMVIKISNTLSNG
jgi:hypothetical protein